MARLIRTLLLFSLTALGFGGGNPARSEPPRKISDYATVDDLETELTSRSAELEPLLTDEAAFTESKKKVYQIASMLVVTAQALAEHDGDSPQKPYAPDMRDAAIQIARADSFAAASGGLTALKAALDSKSAKTAPVEYDWAKLVKQRPIMEDTESRMLLLQRALRRPKDPVVESRLAVAVAIASLPTLVDTHEVKDKSMLPEWDKLSVQMLDQMQAVTAAIRNKDNKGAQDQFKAARATCVECHRLFKKEN